VYIWGLVIVGDVIVPAAGVDTILLGSSTASNLDNG
jgi:hypothetical protein